MLVARRCVAGCLAPLVTVAALACSANNPAFDGSGHGTGVDDGATPGPGVTSADDGVTTGGGAQDSSTSRSASTDEGDATTADDPDGSDNEADTGVGTGDTEPPRTQRCAEMLWAVSDSAELRLINLATGTVTLWADLPAPSWAVATLRNGRLVVAEHEVAQTAFVLDPFGRTDTQEVTLNLSAAGEMSRATVDLNGDLWLATSDTDQIWRLSIAAPEAPVVEDAPGGTYVTAGDHAFLANGDLLVVGFEASVAILDAETLELVDFAEGIARFDDDLTGVVVEDRGEIWVSELNGDIFRLALPERTSDWGLEFQFGSGSPIDDLAPVIAPVGQCPH